MSDKIDKIYKIAKLMESGKQWWIMDEFRECVKRANVEKLARMIRIPNFLIQTKV